MDDRIGDPCLAGSGRLAVCGGGRGVYKDEVMRC